MSMHVIRNLYYLALGCSLTFILYISPHIVWNGVYNLNSYTPSSSTQNDYYGPKDKAKLNKNFGTLYHSVIGDGMQTFKNPNYNRILWRSSLPKSALKKSIGSLDEYRNVILPHGPRDKGFKVLIISNPAMLALHSQLVYLLSGLRISYHTLKFVKEEHSFDSFLAIMTQKLLGSVREDQALYDLIIIEDVDYLFNVMGSLEKGSFNDNNPYQRGNVTDVINGLRRYIKEYLTPILTFTLAGKWSKLKDQSIFDTYVRKRRLRGIYVNPNSTIPHVLTIPNRTNEPNGSRSSILLLDGDLNQRNHVKGMVLSNLSINSKRYDTVASTRLCSGSPLNRSKTQIPKRNDDSLVCDKTISLVVYKGPLPSRPKLLDRIAVTFFGIELTLWPIKLLFYDSLYKLLNISLTSRNYRGGSQDKWRTRQLARLLNLERFISVDIDDVFVGSANPTRSDIQELYALQDHIQKSNIPNFRLYLGYSGKLYKHTNRSKQLGYDYLMEIKDKFSWFPHTWDHRPPHENTNFKLLRMDMKNNAYFAKKHKLGSLSLGYAVSPKHSGIYPVDPILYAAWKDIYNISVTSTIAYPGSIPYYGRRGFIHDGIKVLPRQNMGVFSYTYNFTQYKGGRNDLDKLIYNEILEYFLFNKVNIFMTHLPNYCHDRVAGYILKKLIAFIQKNTNLKLRTESPKGLADIYFQTYPEDKDAVWTNPCDDTDHMKLWNRVRDCAKFPRILILGPQKTGTTALQWYLNMIPGLSSSQILNTTFEETQFFSGQHYQRGINWYLDLFGGKDTNTVIKSPVLDPAHPIFIDKSATYFDSTLTPFRANSLLPRAYLIVILKDPIERAYSWYQHVKSKNDLEDFPSFYDVLVGENETSHKIEHRHLNKMTKRGIFRDRCLTPGQYITHFNRWLQYYPPEQILLVDGYELVHHPAKELASLQKLMNLPILLNFDNVLRYDESKKYFCKVESLNRTKCLPPSKGRKYPSIDSRSNRYLAEYYKKYNIDLLKMINSTNFKRKVIPHWLRK